MKQNKSSINSINENRIELEERRNRYEPRNQKLSEHYNFELLSNYDVLKLLIYKSVFSLNGHLNIASVIKTVINIQIKMKILPNN